MLALTPRVAAARASRGATGCYFELRRLELDRLTPGELCKAGLTELHELMVPIRIAQERHKMEHYLAWARDLIVIPKVGRIVLCRHPHGVRRTLRRVVASAGKRIRPYLLQDPIVCAWPGDSPARL